MTKRPVVRIDGARFDDLEGFYDEVERVLAPGEHWGRNLDAFNDSLPAGINLRWVHAARSREHLGFAQTARWLEGRLAKVHPTNRADFEHRLAEARAGRGPTLFDTLVEILRAHEDLEFSLVE